MTLLKDVKGININIRKSLSNCAGDDGNKYYPLLDISTVMPATQ